MVNAAETIQGAVRSVAVGVWLKRGSRHERAEQSGISHFIEHMVFKGTKNRSAQRIAEEMDSIGGHMDAFTAKEYASFHLKVVDEHLPVAVDILGVVDACGDSTTITIDSIFQDEPLDAEGDGNTEPDAFGVGTSALELRAERAGTRNGRVYHIDFTATDFRDQTCTGTVTVGVPHDRQDTPVDDGRLYDSTGGS